MKITEKYLSLPPYLSTTWDNISSVFMQEEKLVLTLRDTQTVTIPGLEQQDVEKIFQMHALFIESEEQDLPDKLIKQASIQFGIGAGLDQAGVALQHNAELSNSPPLPDEVIKKVRSIASIVAGDSMEIAPEAEPHCHCPYCQIARAIQQGLEPSEDKEIESGKPLEISHNPWEIEQVSDKLFLVSNRLSPDEHYQVHLGEPVGCTCGETGCTHLLHVLRS